MDPTVATDDVAGVHYQRVKLVVGTLDSTAATGVDASPLVVRPVVGATATLANVAGSATSVTLQASNVNRRGLTIVNDSTAVLYVKFGATASATSFSYKLEARDTLELPSPLYTGVVDGLWASAAGSARMTELA